LNLALARIQTTNPREQSSRPSHLHLPYQTRPSSYPNCHLVASNPPRTLSSSEAGASCKPRNVLLPQDPPPQTPASLRNLNPPIPSLTSPFTRRNRRHTLSHALDPKPHLQHPPRNLLANRLPKRPTIRPPVDPLFSTYLCPYPPSTFNLTTSTQTHHPRTRLEIRVARSTALRNGHGLRLTSPPSP
jgi:hypothetical protein